MEVYNKAIHANGDDGPVCDVLQRQKFSVHASLRKRTVGKRNPTP